MARQRWLVLAGCLALLRLLPACGKQCLNPQPEPPGGGCDNEMSTTGRSDGGPTSIGPDARIAADARSSADSAVEGGPGPSPEDAGVDFDSSDSSDDMSVDSSGDGVATATDAPDEGAADVADSTADGASSDARDDGASNDAQDDGPKDAPDIAVSDGTGPD